MWIPFPSNRLSALDLVSATEPIVGFFYGIPYSNNSQTVVKKELDFVKVSDVILAFYQHAK